MALRLLKNTTTLVHESLVASGEREISKDALAGFVVSWLRHSPQAATLLLLDVPLLQSRISAEIRRELQGDAMAPSDTYAAATATLKSFWDFGVGSEQEIHTIFCAWQASLLSPIVLARTLNALATVRTFTRLSETGSHELMLGFASGASQAIEPYLDHLIDRHVFTREETGASTSQSSYFSAETQNGVEVDVSRYQPSLLPDTAWPAQLLPTIDEVGSVLKILLAMPEVRLAPPSIPAIRVFLLSKSRGTRETGIRLAAALKKSDETAN